MKCRVVSDAGDKWSVRLDIRDLGGHLDSTFRAVTLGSLMASAIPSVRAVAVLPLDFVGRLRILRTMHLLGALHGAEASLVYFWFEEAQDCLLSGFFVWWSSFG